ncbi:hypothetical protein ACFT9M_10220 [Micromonospora purpureochromogenes]|uniref:hypothetical protein n=1 Tax=Micromonospora purpureochromogenes TaxID=47872 RepID=UPI003628C114
MVVQDPVTIRAQLDGMARFLRDVGVNTLANICAWPFLYVLAAAAGVVPRNRVGIGTALGVLAVVAAALAWFCRIRDTVRSWVMFVGLAPLAVLLTIASLLVLDDAAPWWIGAIVVAVEMAFLLRYAVRSSVNDAQDPGVHSSAS